MIVVLALFATVTVAGAAVGWWWSSQRLLHSKRRRRALVTLLSGETFDGVLVASDRDALVLGSAAIAAEDQVPIDGEIVLLREQIAYLQLP